MQNVITGLQSALDEQQKKQVAETFQDCATVAERTS